MTIVQIIGVIGVCGWAAYAARAVIKSRRRPPEPVVPPSGEAGELLTSWPVAVLLRCGCCITYHDDGDARLAPCYAHAHHASWRLWEQQMGASK